MRLLCTWIAAVLVMVPMAPRPATGSEGRAVEFPLPSGHVMHGTYFSPGGRGPVVVLFHQCDRTSTSWNGLASALARRGLHVLTWDYRGVGSNRHLPNDYSLRLTDAAAAVTWVVGQPGVDGTRVAAGGASCGVNEAASLARRDRRIAALLLMSGGADAAGIEYVRSGRIPVFFAFSADEGGPLPAMKASVVAGRHPRSVVRELNRAGHGTPMFDADATLLPSVADWMVQVLR